MSKKGYIGITGFTSRPEIKEVLGSQKFNRPIMIGVLATEKTLNGIEKKNNHNRYPKIGLVKDIFPKKSLGVINLVHYSTESKDGLLKQLIELTKLCGNNLDGFQLNTPWPPISSIKEYKSQYHEKTIVLQMGTTAFNLLRCDTGKIFQKLKDYEDYIDYIIFDFSGGKGKQLDIGITNKCLSLAKKFNISTSIIIAGGLNDSNIKMVKPIIEKFPEVGIDAESGLRNSKDFLDINKAQRYLKECFVMVS
jgi:phosphoribosylanthranilate isomerase